MISMVLSSLKGKIPTIIIIVVISSLLIGYRIYLQGVINNLKSTNTELMDQNNVLRSNNYNLMNAISIQNEALDKLESENKAREFELQSQLKSKDDEFNEKLHKLNEYYESINLGDKCEMSMEWLRGRGGAHKW